MVIEERYLRRYRGSVRRSVLVGFGWIAESLDTAREVMLSPGGDHYAEFRSPREDSMGEGDAGELEVLAFVEDHAR